MKLDGKRWHFSAVDDLTVAERGEAAHAISLAMIDPPRPPDELRRVPIRQCLAQYEGSLSNRAKMLERQYRSYLGAGWQRERDMETLPEPRSVERALLHRLSRLGCPSGWRRILDIANSSQDCRCD